jgi:ankyrin repeat protein
MHAAAAGNTDIVGCLLAKGAAINMLDDVAGVSALQLAVQGGDLRTVRLLVGHGAKINLQAPCNGFSPLMNAVWYRHPEIVEYFAKREERLKKTELYVF